LKHPQKERNPFAWFDVSVLSDNISQTASIRFELSPSSAKKRLAGVYVVVITGYFMAKCASIGIGVECSSKNFKISVSSGGQA